MRNLKTMGLALVAIFAMSAMGAAAAQAESDAYFWAEEGTVQIDVEAEGNQTFGTPGKATSCETLDGHAAYEEETKELTGTEVVLTECDTVILGFIHFPTTVFPEEGCHATFTAGTLTGEDAKGSVRICELTINQYTDESHEKLYCQQHWPAQTIKGLAYTNSVRNEVPTVTVDINAEIEATVTDFANTGCNSHETTATAYAGAFWAYGTDKAGEVTETEVPGAGGPSHEEETHHEETTQHKEETHKEATTNEEDKVPATFAAEVGTVQIDVEAEGNQDFNNTAGQAMTCEVLDGHAAYSKETEASTATEFNFTECDTVILGFIHFPTTVFPEEGCHFTFTAGTWTGEDAEGSVHICDVTINQYTSSSHETLYCQQHWPAQIVEGLTYTNVEGAVTVDVEAEIETTVTDFNKTGCNNHETVMSDYEGAFWAYGTDENEEESEIEVTGEA